MGKITTYTAIGGKMERESENFERVVDMVSHAMMTDFEEAEAFVLGCEKEGKRLIAVYPAFGEVDTSAWELLGDIMDGALYVGKAE